MQKQRTLFNKIFQGFLSLTAAKIFFMIAGYAVYFTLPRIFDSPGEFGNYGVIIGLLNVFNMVLITGTIQAVSKFVSEREGLERSIRHSAFKIQSIIGGGIFLLLFFGAPFFANQFGDLSLVPYIRVGAFVPLSYSFYAVFVGSLNGRKLFVHQAALDITFASLKTVFIIGLAVLGFGVLGAISGFAIAAFTILIIASILVTRKASPIQQQPFPVQKILSFEVGVIIITFLTNLLINTDLFMVKSLLDTSIASVHTGYYTAVQTFARIPYTMVISISLVVFPLISKSTFENDINTTRNYIRNSLRISILIVVPVAVIFSCFAGDFLNVVYPDDYANGANALQILPLGQILLALMFVSVTMITGSGYLVVSICITALALAVDIIGCWILIPRYSIVGAAISSSAAWGVGFIISMVWLYYKFQAMLSLKTLARVLLSIGIMAICVQFVPCHGFTRIVLGSTLIGVGYIIFLFLFKEITIEEISGLLKEMKK